MNRSGQRACAGALAFVLSVSGLGATSYAEAIEITHCYSGTVVTISQIKDVPPVFSWAQNGIIMSAHPKKLLHNAVVHCEGVQTGAGAARSGYGLCKIVDDDGDAIIAEIPLKGLDYEVKLLHGTGKWKGVTGTLRSTPIVRSQPNKGAMPDTYQTCRREAGQFEVPK